MVYILKTFRLPEETVAEIQSLAAQYGSQSKVIQTALAQLKSQKGQSLNLPTTKHAPLIKGELSVHYDSKD